VQRDVNSLRAPGCQLVHGIIEKIVDGAIEAVAWQLTQRIFHVGFEHRCDAIRVLAQGRPPCSGPDVLDLRLSGAFELVQRAAQTARDIGESPLEQAESALLLGR